MSFALIRGRHFDMTVLGELQVDGQGRLANWTFPGRLLPGMVGAMDLATGARRVSLVVTELAVIEPEEGGLIPRERAPGVTVDAVRAATAAALRVEGDVPWTGLAKGTCLAAQARE